MKTYKHKQLWHIVYEIEGNPVYSCWTLGWETMMIDSTIVENGNEWEKIEEKEDWIDKVFDECCNDIYYPHTNFKKNHETIRRLIEKHMPKDRYEETEEKKGCGDKMCSKCHNIWKRERWEFNYICPDCIPRI